MSPGKRGRARQRAAPLPPAAARSTIRCNGGFIFAERPDLAAPDARIIWHADFDPAALRVVAVPVDHHDDDGFDPDALAAWLTVAIGADGQEHAVLSDGWHHIRLDVEAGSLTRGGPVVLHYRLHGLDSARQRIMSLRRFLHLCRHRRFSAELFPADTHVPRGLQLLQVNDAITSGASQREIAQELFGAERIEREWRQGTESLRSRVRRLVTESRAMARGGYRSLMTRLSGSRGS